MMQAQAEARRLATTADVARRSVEVGYPLTTAGIRAAATRGDLVVAEVVGKGQRLYEWEAVEAFLRERLARAEALTSRGRAA